MTAFLALAPAKINLALAVGAREDDGLHPICSWMVTVDLFDELLVTRLPAGRLSRYAILWHAEARRRTDIDWSVSRDLAVLAHLALERRLGRSLPVQLKLEKRIPVGAGLGGGSSDAAAMLLALDRLFALDLDEAVLLDVAAEIGADVPFLVRGGSALVEGRGERIAPHADTPPLHVALVMPGYACATGRVYGRFDDLPANADRADAVRDLAASTPRVPGAETLFNDLAPAAMLEAPGLADDLDRVTATAERPAMLSGSGSTIFVVCDDELHAEYLAAAIEKTHDLAATAARATAGPPRVVPHDVSAASTQD